MDGVDKMKDEIKSELDALFADDTSRKIKAEEKRDLEPEAQASFLQQFRGKIDEIIVPAFEEFASHLLQHGWSAEVKRQGEQLGDGRFGPEAAANPVQPERVSLLFSKATSTVRGIGGRADRPAFTVACDKRARKINFHEMTPSRAGGAGAATLEELTTDYLQKNLLSYFKNLMQDSRPYNER